MDRDATCLIELPYERSLSGETANQERDDRNVAKQRKQTLFLENPVYDKDQLFRWLEYPIKIGCFQIYFTFIRFYENVIVNLK